MSIWQQLGLRQFSPDLENENNLENKNNIKDNNEEENINIFVNSEGEDNFNSSNLLEENYIELPDISDEKEKSQNDIRKNQDKTRVIIQPILQDHYYPWQIKNQISCKYNGIIKLHYEIYEFYNFIKLSEKELKIREDIIKSIHSLILIYNNSWSLEKHGSFLYGISLPISEIDLLLIPSSFPKDLLHPLHKICEIFIKSNKFSFVQVVPLKSPFILLLHKQSNIRFKISYPLFRQYAQVNQILINILTSYPYMKPIICLLKYVLYQKQLSEISKGGINSHTLFYMLYFYILYLQKMMIYDENNLLNLGELFIGFLDFYGFNFNYNKLGISINYGGYFYEKEEKSNINNKKHQISIQNFQDISKDLGRNIHRYKKIVDCFKVIRDSLLFPSEFPFKSYLGFFIYEDECIKNRNAI